jgi:hypothetical protein
MSVTIDEAIAALQKAKILSPLAGRTVLVLSLTDSELEDRPINEIEFVSVPPGGLVEVRVLSLLVNDALARYDNS